MSRKSIWTLIKILIMLKIALYYYLIEVTHNFPIVYIITLCVVSVIFLIKSRLIATLVYTIITLIMFGNTTNYVHFNELLSVEKTGNIELLPAVMQSVIATIEPVHLLLFFDVLILFIFAFTKKKKNKKRRQNRNFVKIVVTSIVVIFIAVLAFNPFNNLRIMSVSNQELFIYHTKDVIVEKYFSKKDLMTTEEEVIHSAYKTIPSDSPYFGLGKDRNLIVIQLEAFQNFVINQEYNGQVITPNINRLLSKDTIYFDQYYQQVGSGNTADAEFVSNNSMFPIRDGYIYDKYENNHYYGLPWLLRENGYSTAAFHGYNKDYWNRSKAYIGQGFEKFYSEDDFIVGKEIGLGLNDIDFFDQSTSYLKTMPQPFYGFLISLSGHHPYYMPVLEDDIELLPEHQETMFGNYIRSMKYVDTAVGELIQDLKDKGLYDQSMIVLYGDHFGLNPNEGKNKEFVGSLLDEPYDVVEMMNIPLIINIPNGGVTRTINTVGGQMDFMPTMLHVLGLNQQKVFHFGQDLFTADKGFVASRTYIIEGSFISDDNVFIMSRDGVFENSEAYQLETKETVPLINIIKEHERALEQIELSDYALENDTIAELILEHKESMNYYELAKDIKPPLLIAHGGGAIGGKQVTNSKESLDFNYYKGFRYFEIDFSWTSDQEPVLIHDWDRYYNEYFGEEASIPSHEEFMSKEMLNSWQQMDLEMLIGWMKKHPDVFIITDAKANNIQLLELIAKEYPELINRFIPQIYYPKEFIQAEYLGYDHIIYTLYKSEDTEVEVQDFILKNNVFAVTMPKERVSDAYKELLNNEDLFIYVHTVNNQETITEMQEIGVDGFYTDTLRESE